MQVPQTVTIQEQPATFGAFEGAIPTLGAFDRGLTGRARVQPAAP
jgi:hypothetical protein